MKPQIPKKEYTGNRACRKETCAPGTDRGSPRSKENDELRWTGRYVPRTLSVPQQIFFLRIYLRGTSLEKPKEAYRKTRGRTFKNFPNPGPAFLENFSIRPLGNFFCPRGDQQDSFRINCMFSLASPVPRINEPIVRPGPCGPETGNGKPVQDRGRTDWPDTIRAGRDQQ